MIVPKSIRNLNYVMDVISIIIKRRNIMRPKAPKFIKYICSKTYTDRSFQRRVCWPDDKIRRFILSVNKNRTPYPIVVADIKSGIFNSTEALDENSLNYYETIKSKGYEWISLDGIQRSTALMKFFNDEITVSGDFIDADGKKVQVTNKYFSRLPQRLQDKFNDVEIEVKVMEDLLRDELKDFFININDGEALNPQEIRNAYPTAISKFIRELSEHAITKDTWIKISGLKQSGINRSLDSELLLKAFMVTHQDENYSPNRTSMDAFYQLGCGKTTINEYRQSVRDRFKSIMSIVRDLCDQQTIHIGKGKIPQRQWWATVFLAAYVYDKNLQIDNYAKVYEEIYLLEKDLIAQSKTKQGKDHESYKKALTTSSPLDEPSDSQYYWHWASEPLKWSERKKRLKELFLHSFDNLSVKAQSSVAAK